MKQIILKNKKFICPYCGSDEWATIDAPSPYLDHGDNFEIIDDEIWRCLNCNKLIKS